MQCLWAVGLLCLLTISVTSGAHTCYSCASSSGNDNPCIPSPSGLGQGHNVSCPFSKRCFTTFITDSSGRVMYGKRGCTNERQDLPFGGLTITWNNACRQQSGITLCHFTCYADFCNSQSLKDVAVSMISSAAPSGNSALGVSAAAAWMLLVHRAAGLL